MIVFPFGSMDAGRWLPVDPASGAASARRMAEDLARTVGLAERRVAQLSIVASEMAGNIAKHAERGAVMVRAVRAGGDAGVELVAVDHLPGIADLALSLQDGYSTTGTLGIDLGAITRQAGWYDIQSTPGRGTIVAAQVWPDRTPDAAWVSVCPGRCPTR